MKNEEVPELTPQEQAAMAALPRERSPSNFLEERTVGALKERGLLRGGNRLRSARRMQMWALGLAASVALFVGGVATGQWLGTRAVTGPMLEQQNRNAMQTAALVQQTGTAYVTALMALAQLADSANDPAYDQGREVALTALYAAARELSVFAPEDPLAAFLRDAFERNVVGNENQQLQSIVWF